MNSRFASSERSLSLALPPATTALSGPRRDQLQSKTAPRSPALALEVRLKEVFEQHPKSPSRDRAKAVFQVLDDAIPLAGALSSVLRTIRTELYAAVYSRNVTSSDADPFVERIPFFATVGKIGEVQTEQASKISEALSEMQQKIKFRDHDLQMLYKKNMALKQEISEKEAEVRQLEDKIRGLVDQSHKQELEKGELRIYHATTQETLKREIERLQTSLAQSNHIIEKLTMFKTAYNDGAADPITEEEREKSKLELNLDSLGLVEYDMYQAERLDEQFSELMNYQLDDFDLSLTQLKKKKEILSGVLMSDTEREKSYKLELHEIVAGFRKRMNDLLDEQKLVQRHAVGLKQVQTDYTSEKKTILRTADGALRKYSAVLHFSNDDGKSFVPFQTTYCGKCGDRTVVCPHRQLVADTIALPAGTTHVKLTKPNLKLRSEYFKRGEKRVMEVDVTEVEMDKATIEATPAMRIVWTDFFMTRKGFKPAVARVYQLDRLLPLIQEIYDSRWAYEEDKQDLSFIIDDEDVTYSRFVDFFYDFMNQRYQIPEVALKAAHDVLTALSQNESTSGDVAVFIRHLAGLEDVMWKYIYLARRLFNKYDNYNLQKYRQIVTVMYPSRPREMYDQMELELVAFSKNRFSREVVEEHLIHMLLNEIEPNQKFFYFGFKRLDYRDVGTLPFEDFDEALSQLLPSAPTKLKRMRYRLAELDTKKDEVPISRLAQIASFINLYGCSKNAWVPQALMSPDFAGMVEGAREGNAMAAIDQDEVDRLLSEGAQAVVPDPKAVEEEEMLMLQRVAM
ncbi:hypothetical protein DFJ73DRAFT_859404 [Zopfochytrium polystomum]|nr:hypothetical protein DFJ73DRAFT_859404 [Zopfochytrium polystomum]